MTPSIDLLPSPFDRLDPVAQAIRWWTDQVTSFFRAPRPKQISLDVLEGNIRRLPRRIEVSLPDKHCFSAQLMLPPGNSEAHARAIRLRLHDLVPLDPASLQIIATARQRENDGYLTYSLVMARRTQLDEVEAAARRRGARHIAFVPDGERTAALLSPRSTRQRRRALVLDGLLAAAVAASAATAVAVWTAHMEQGTRALADEERALRRAAVAAQTARREGEVARTLIDRGILKRRAGTVMEALAAFNAATPAEAWWTSVRWAPDQVTITAHSPNATAAIEAMSAGAKAWSVELAGSIAAAAPPAPQTFELLLRPREALPQ